jgi:hypothetical protein
MPLYQKVKVIEIDDEDDQGALEHPPSSRRPRSGSVISIASSGTLCGDSPEVPDISRLSVEPGRTPRPYTLVPRDNNIGQPPAIDRELGQNIRNGGAAGTKRPANPSFEQNQQGSASSRHSKGHRLAKDTIIILDKEDEDADAQLDHNEVLASNVIEVSGFRTRDPQAYRNNVFFNDSKFEKHSGSQSVGPQDTDQTRQGARVDEPAHAISLDSDDDDHDGLVAHPANFNRTGHNIIDVDEFDANRAAAAFHQQSAYENQQPRQIRGQLPLRNPPISFPNFLIESFSWKGRTLKPQDIVELSDGSFLMIKILARNSITSKVVLRGYRLVRTKLSGSFLQKTLNEIAFVLEVDMDDPRPAAEQAVVEVEGSMVKRVREVVCTNAAFPAYRFEADQLPGLTEIRGKYDRVRYIEKNGLLVARWKATTTFISAIQRRDHLTNPNKYDSRRIEVLSLAECTSGHSVPPSRRRIRWRQCKTILGGSAAEATINGVRIEQKYTSTDICKYLIS